MDPRTQAINETIQSEKKNGHDTGQISDGYHTFNELYDHRVELFISVCKVLSSLIGFGIMSSKHPHDLSVWKSLKHSDGSKLDGWFMMGISKQKGDQISYHLPISRWTDCSFAEVLDIAPEWDGHTSDDVLKRLKSL
jgi:hypothetical protein